jgi:hypothetical protein
MSIADEGKQSLYAARYLSEVRELIRLQEEIVALLRSRETDAEVAENVLLSLRTAAAIVADVTNAVEDKEGHSGTDHDSPKLNATTV